MSGANLGNNLAPPTLSNLAQPSLSNLAQPTLSNLAPSTLSNLAQPSLTNLSSLVQPPSNLNQSTGLSSSTDIFEELASQASFSTSQPENPVQVDLPTDSNSLLQGSSATSLLPPHSSLLQPPPFLLQPDASIWEEGVLLESTYEEKLEPFHNESKGVLESSYEEETM